MLTACLFSAPINAEVIGQDERFPVADAASQPYRTIGLILTDQGTCTATLIGRKHILTAAHCLYDVQQGNRWKSNPYFIPAKNGLEDGPYGAYRIARAYMDKSYIKSANAAYQKGGRYLRAETNETFHHFVIEDMIGDIAIAELEQPAGEQVGWLGFRAMAEYEPAPYIHLAGYPAEKSPHTLWTTNCQTRRQQGGNLTHKCDTSPGMSGAAAYIKDYEGRFVAVGLFSVGTSSYNYIVPFSSDLFDKLTDWREGRVRSTTMSHQFKHGDRYFLNFANQCSESIDVAIHYQDGSGVWATSPWSTLRENQLKKLASTPNREFFLRYRSHANPERQWGGQDAYHAVSGENSKRGFKRHGANNDKYAPSFHILDCPAQENFS